MSNKNIHIDRWFEDRGIVKNGKAMSQAIKTLEEVTELFDALNKKDTTFGMMSIN